ncbi:Acetyl-coenzyme A carboxyl transferase alpha chain (EC / Acetyl-coenzyme A carboxyl transferase beta chain (EC; Propionyl-CoA carboxylase beta chain (EC [Olavius sp. associated proteobacterium Delta 1]|nr:Acetyl-coenzyme A carboxyl transferase alpha chain (EC / Acetyl-coenzyme A carboxyl transferase beta chain (EC; Propionyl-CoA carboxylase beta chain (EC [Olavius sp. associated proteobacterium Delta 1]
MTQDKTHQNAKARLDSLENRAEMGGGPKAIERHHQRGKLTARERLGLLFDADSFVEVNRLAQSQSVDFGMQEKKVPGDGVVTGYGTIAGRLVFAYAQDVTVLGGSVGTIHGQKICRIMDEAIKVKAPLVALNDSGGGRLHEGFFASRGVAGMFYRNTAASGLIPQITGMMGSSAGVAVYSPALTDFIVMVKGQSHMVITGPAIIREVTGEDISLEELGGAKVHSEITGQAHLVAESDQQCIEIIKKLLSYLPSNNEDQPPVVDSTDDPDRVDDALEDMVPADFKKSYDMRQVILRVVDKEDFYEIQPRYATNIIIGFARLDGSTIGIVANQPRVKAGCLDVNASDKAARFIRFCDAFNIPLINLVDVPGYFPGVTQEHAGIIRHGAKMLYAYSEASVPKITLALRKEYGGAVMGMCCVGMGVDLMLAWPIARLVVLDTTAAVNLIFRKEIKAAENPDEFRQQKIEEYDYKYSNPYHAASNMLVDSVINPRETRPRLIKALKMLKNKQRPQPNKRHGNIPL